jgi:L-lactate dehydrogenase (cytochrome)
MKDRGFVRDLIERAAAARCSACATVDLQGLGQRHIDIKNGLSVPPSLKLKNLLDMMGKPRGSLSVLAGKRWTFGNLAGHAKGQVGVKSLTQWVGSQFDQALNWKDVEWVRSLWPGKLIIKGILDEEDARLAVRTGASAWWCRTTVAVNSMEQHRRVLCCRGLPTLSAPISKSCSMGVFAAARTYSAHWRLVRGAA